MERRHELEPVFICELHCMLARFLKVTAVDWTNLAPKLFIAAFLSGLLSSGTTMVTGMPWARPA
jgi:hypothetical protein